MNARSDDFRALIFSQCVKGPLDWQRQCVCLQGGPVNTISRRTNQHNCALYLYCWRCFFIILICVKLLVHWVNAFIDFVGWMNFLWLYKFVIHLCFWIVCICLHGCRFSQVLNEKCSPCHMKRGQVKASGFFIYTYHTYDFIYPVSLQITACIKTKTVYWKRKSLKFGMKSKIKFFIYCMNKYISWWFFFSIRILFFFSLPRSFTLNKVMFL